MFLHRIAINKQQTNKQTTKQTNNNSKRTGNIIGGFSAQKGAQEAWRTVATYGQKRRQPRT
jgi:hypothetical protein